MHLGVVYCVYMGRWRFGGLSSFGRISRLGTGRYPIAILFCLVSRHVTGCMEKTYDFDGKFEPLTFCTANKPHTPIKI